MRLRTKDSYDGIQCLSLSLFAAFIVIDCNYLGASKYLSDLIVTERFYSFCSQFYVLSRNSLKTLFAVSLRGGSRLKMLNEWYKKVRVFQATALDDDGFGHFMCLGGSVLHKSFFFFSSLSILAN